MRNSSQLSSVPRWFRLLSGIGLRLLRPFLPAAWLAKLEHAAWFIAVGSFNTLSSYLLYVFVLYLFACSREVALLVGYGLGMLLAYLNFSRLVFGGGSSAAFYRFIPAYLVLYAVNALMLRGVVVWGHLGNELGQFLLLPVVAVLSYGINRLFVFRTHET